MGEPGQRGDEDGRGGADGTRINTPRRLQLVSGGFLDFLPKLQLKTLANVQFGQRREANRRRPVVTFLWNLPVAVLYIWDLEFAHPGNLYGYSRLWLLVQPLGTAKRRDQE